MCLASGLIVVEAEMVNYSIASFCIFLLFKMMLILLDSISVNFTFQPSQRNICVLSKLELFKILDTVSLAAEEEHHKIVAKAFQHVQNTWRI